MVKKLEIKLKTITPLFMGNAHKRAEPRPQSFNGMFRWWFRAAGGSIKDEKRLFGWTDNASRRGVINIRIKNQSIEKKPFSKEFQRDDGGYAIAGSGINYMGFALDERFKKEQTGKRQREYLMGAFTLEIFFHPMANEEDIRKFMAVLWLSINLGNFGTRSRRCFGSLKIESIRGNPDDVPLSFFPDLENLKGWIKENLDWIIRMMGNSPRPHIPHIAGFEIYRVRKENWKRYHNWVKTVQKGRKGKYLVKKWHKDNERNPFESPLDMCDFMGFLMNAYRSYYEPDHTNAFEIIIKRDRDIKRIDRAGFGLPLPFYFSSKKRKGTVDLIIGNSKTRRASPLLLKVLANEKDFEGLFIHMKSPFKPGNARIELSGISVREKSDIVNDFLESLRKFSIVEGLY